MKIIKLRHLVPIEQSQYAREALPLFGILAAANALFAFFFDFLHESYFLLMGLFFLNAILAFKLSYLTWRRLLFFTKGKRRGSKTFLLAFIAELIPLYHLYLIYQCMKAHEKKSHSAFSLALKPLAICFIATVTLMVMSFPRAPKALGVILDPTLTYVANVALDSYRVFNLQDRIQSECIESNDWKCFQKATAKEVFPGTNTAIILSVAADALTIFKKKTELEKSPDFDKKKHHFIVAKALLESNSYYLKKNNCHIRTTPINVSGPIPMVTGLQNAYLLQLVDTRMSHKFARVARERLIELAQDTLKRSDDEEISRSVASVNDAILESTSETCGIKPDILAVGHSGNLSQ
jgi:hypothetical protein